MIDRASDDHEPVLIPRDGGKPAAVLMSLEDFPSYEQTANLLHGPANAERLLKAFKRTRCREGEERKLLE